jgi:hypothetical protein
VVALLVALLTAGLQIHFGMVPKDKTFPSIVSVAIPLIALIFAYICYHAARTPWLLDKERQQQIANSNAERARDSGELEEARKPKFPPARIAQVKELYDKLDARERAVLREVVYVGRSRGDMSPEQAQALKGVETKTGFVSRTFVGSYAASEASRPILEAIFESEGPLLASPETAGSPPSTSAVPAAAGAPLLEMRPLTSRPIVANRSSIPAILLPFRNISLVDVAEVVAHIRFEDVETGQTHDVNYGFWVESPGMRTDFAKGDTKHIALVGLVRFTNLIFDGKSTRRYAESYGPKCQTTQIKDGTWRIEIEMDGESGFRQHSELRLKLSKGRAHLVQDPELQDK